ncbi:hypothetical protein [Nonomuraea sp. LPB2021202275-12-8]|uniref:hypothetical protein n=1 Tax=Nonomuraea sp. LPB2021202275-12-8 TaxID=3120159 RepID=UPI00300D13AB
MDTRRRRQVRRRPVVLFAALLAPAIFAGGLLAGELSRYEHTGARVDVEGGRAGRMVFEPVLVPAPAHPIRQYVAAVPAPVVEVPVVQVVAAPRDVVPSVPVREPVPTPTVERRPDPPAPAQSECPGEWVDTWLWEMCREHERRPGEGWSGDS